MSSKKSDKIGSSGTPSPKQDCTESQRSFKAAWDLNIEITEYSDKLSGPFSKIDSVSCLDEISSLCVSVLGDNPSCQELVQSILESIDKLRSRDFSSVSKLILFRDFKFQSLTPLTRSSSILKDIRNFLVDNRNPVVVGCFKPFNASLLRKCTNPCNVEECKTEIKQMVVAFSQFAAKVLCQVFWPLFHLLKMNEKEVMVMIKQKLVPVLITQAAEWKQVYPRIIKVFGKRGLKVLRDQQPSYFEMQEAFNCESSPNPFIRTIVTLQALDSKCSIKNKLKILREIPVNMKLDIEDHQQSTILGEEVQFGHSDILPCLQYCIMKADRPGLLETIEYIELFYGKHKGAYYQQSVLDKSNVSHVVDSIKAAGTALRQRDTQLSILLSNVQ